MRGAKPPSNHPQIVRGRGLLPEVQVIGLSMFQEAERADAMRQAGAVTYLAKSGPADALVAAIRDCAAKRT